MARSTATLTPVGEAMAAAIEPEELAEPAPKPNANDVDFGEGAPNAETEIDEDDPSDPEIDPEPEPEVVRRAGKYQDPRQSIVEWARKRVEAMLQPVDDDPAWHGVFAVTRKDLAAALMDVLPEASAQVATIRASVWEPGYIYATAVCPKCHQAVDALMVIRPQLVVGTEGEIKLKGKTQAIPHVCGQTRLVDVTPERPVPGQQALPVQTEAETSFEEMADHAGDAEVLAIAQRAVDDEFEDAPRLAIAGSEGSRPLDLGSCPYPDCDLAAEHPGGHQDALGIDDEIDGSDLPF
jgi:hypothetical protein